jgi:heme/copper-type cytochrome/quinol oxidase subunit 2
VAELHVHGVELARPVIPGKPTVVQFRFEEPGVFNVELHDPELLLVRLVAR